jgi:hypothetical protein
MAIIKSLINNRKILKNNFLSKNLLNQGLYEEAAKLQQPTIESINKTSNEIKLLRDVVEKPKNSSDVKSLMKQSLLTLPEPIISTPEDEEILNIINNITQSTSTNCTLNFLKKDVSGISLYSLGVSNKEIFALKNTSLYNLTSNENYQLPSVGVSKLLFEHNPSDENITKEDIDEYKKFLTKYKFNITQANKRKIYYKFYPSKNNSGPIIEDLSTNSNLNEEVIGDGIKPNIKTIVLPSNNNDLINDLMLQLSAVDAGNNGNFNYVNSLLKESLKRKIINAKDYRNILKVYFHI